MFFSWLWKWLVILCEEHKNDIDFEVVPVKFNHILTTFEPT